MVETLLRFFPKQEIYGSGGLYLTRYTLLHLGKKAIRIKLHRFHRADEDVEHHNHPWRWGVSLILRGGYVEEHATGVRHTYRPGNINVIWHHTFHRVERLLATPTWTLFVAGPLVSTWGFLDTRNGGEYIHWKEFIRRKGLAPLEET